MPTLNDIFNQLNAAERRAAVWRKVFSHLSEFISRDASPAEQQIVLDSGAVIPEAIIQEVMDIIQEEHIAPTDALRRKLLEADLKVLASTTDEVEEKPKKKKLAQSR